MLLVELFQVKTLYKYVLLSAVHVLKIKRCFNLVQEKKDDGLTTTTRLKGVKLALESIEVFTNILNKRMSSFNNMICVDTGNTIRCALNFLHTSLCMWYRGNISSRFYRNSSEFLENRDEMLLVMVSGS